MIAPDPEQPQPSARPFGLDRLHNNLTRAGFDVREVTELSPLAPLSRDEVRELARKAGRKAP